MFRITIQFGRDIWQRIGITGKILGIVASLVTIGMAIYQFLIF